MKAMMLGQKRVACFSLRYLISYTIKSFFIFRSCALAENQLLCRRENSQASVAMIFTIDSYPIVSYSAQISVPEKDAIPHGNDPLVDQAVDQIEILFIQDHTGTRCF